MFLATITTRTGFGLSHSRYSIMASQLASQRTKLVCTQWNSGQELQSAAPIPSLRSFLKTDSRYKANGRLDPIRHWHLRGGSELKVIPASLQQAD